MREGRGKGKEGKYEPGAGGNDVVERAVMWRLGFYFC